MEKKDSGNKKKEVERERLVDSERVGKKKGLSEES